MVSYKEQDISKVMIKISILSIIKNIVVDKRYNVNLVNMNS